MGLHSETVTDHDDRGFGWMARPTTTTVSHGLVIFKRVFLQTIPSKAVGVDWEKRGEEFD